MSIMSPFLLLLLVVASIWTRLSDCAIILESPTSDDTSLAIDPSNLFDPGTSVLDPKVAAIDKESKLSTDGELTPTYDCFSYNVPFKSRLRVRECDPTNLRTRPENESDGETDTTPEGHSGRDFQPPNEENKTPSDQGEAEPEKEPGGLPTNVSAQNPWAECRKYLRGLLKYAVCDNPDPNYTHYQPLPLLYLNAPFWTLFHCTLAVSQLGLGLYTCPHPDSQVWCCWHYDVDQNVAVGCLTLYYLELAGDVFPPLPLLP